MPASTMSVILKQSDILLANPPVGSSALKIENRREKFPPVFYFLFFVAPYFFLFFQNISSLRFHYIKYPLPIARLRNRKMPFTITIAL